MMSAAAVLVCALALLGRSTATFPRIELLDVRPVDVSAGAEAFVRRNPDVIYVLTDTDVFAAARLGSAEATAKLASILAHEDWHIRHGADERRAYEAQLKVLNSLGWGPNTRVYHRVVRAMLVVTEPATQRPRQVLASRR